MYQLVKKTLKEAGELMVKMSDGQTFELHLHNTDFDDKGELIILDTGTEKYWISSQEIAYLWTHKKKD